MALNLRKIKEITLIPDATGTAYGKALISYEVGSTDDSDLAKPTAAEYELSGSDLTEATTLWATIKAKVESDEGL